MRSLWTALIALCLVTAGSARAPQLVVGGATAGDHVAAYVTAPHAVPAMVKHRRRGVTPDLGVGPALAPIGRVALVPPVVAVRSVRAARSPAPTPPLLHPRTSRGPPPG